LKRGSTEGNRKWKNGEGEEQKTESNPDRARTWWDVFRYFGKVDSQKGREKVGQSTFARSESAGFKSLIVSLRKKGGLTGGEISEPKESKTKKKPKPKGCMGKGTIREIPRLKRGEGGYAVRLGKKQLLITPRFIQKKRKKKTPKGEREQPRRKNRLNPR